MRVKGIAILLTFTFIFSTIGCSDSSEIKKEISVLPPPVQTNYKATAKSGNIKRLKFDDLPSNAVLISVNGKNLTKETFLKWVDLRKKLLSSSLTNATMGNDPTIIIKEQMLSTVTNDYVSQVGAIDYANAIGIKVGTNQIEICRKAFMRGAKISGGTWESVLKRFSAVQRETINERIVAEATVAAVGDYFFKTNKVEIDQVEIDALYADYLKYNRKCAVSNEFVWAKASNIWNRVRSGESFENLALQFDEDEYREEDGVWGDFRVTDFTDEPEIWKLTPRFRPGWVSPPVEADNGITILKINSISDSGSNVNTSEYVPSPSAEINISRIFIHLPLFIEEVSKEQFNMECQRAKKRSALNKFFEDLVSKADIKYPCGTEIFGAQTGDGPAKFLAP